MGANAPPCGEETPLPRGSTQAPHGEAQATDVVSTDRSQRFRCFQASGASCTGSRLARIAPRLACRELAFAVDVAYPGRPLASAGRYLR